MIEVEIHEPKPFFFLMVLRKEVEKKPLILEAQLVRRAGIFCWRA